MDWRRSARDRISVIASFAAVAALCLFLFSNNQRLDIWGTSRHWQPNVLLDQHPVDRLLRQGDDNFNHLLGKETQTIDEAAAAYRVRRGRHPPPGFAKWYQWAKNHDAVMIEDMFDQIYEDLEIFWSMEPSTLRQAAETWPVAFTIRNGNITVRQATKGALWTFRWENLLNNIPPDGLPDVDLAVNTDDEPHIFVPWEDVQERMKIALATRHVDPPNASHRILHDFARYPPLANVSVIQSFPDMPQASVWELAQGACPPDSPARTAEQDTDFTTPTIFPSSLAHMPDGYIHDFIESKNVCNLPHLRNMHGFFVGAKNGSFLHVEEPGWEQAAYHDDQFNTRIPFPLFSSAKIRGVNNDILIPAAMHWGIGTFGGEFHFIEDDAVPWENKTDQVTWRGASSGGVSTRENWTRFHRHRFVSMLNSTQVAAKEKYRRDYLPAHVPHAEEVVVHNFALPDPSTYPLTATASPGGLSEWIDGFSNVSFTYMKCEPKMIEWATWGSSCPYTDPFYKHTPQFTLMEFFKSKYLPDVDGASFSGRWRAYLISGSMPIKASIWSEWFDERMIPWRHFVPMDNTYMDLWGILEYLIGTKPVDGARDKGKSAAWRPGHEHEAKRVAEAGREWSHRVLRDEDMILYFWRVILEYARICDDRRLRLGWVEDLKRRP